MTTLRIGASQNPRRGNYGGGTYTVSPQLLDTGSICEHEAQTGPLAARAGALKLDYLRARLPTTWRVWSEMPGYVGEMTPRERGWRGWYDTSWHVLEGGLVAACSDSHRSAVEGVLLDLPGRACDCLEDPNALLRWVVSAGGVFRRADFALDDRAGVITLDRIKQAVERGAVVTRWKGNPTVISNPVVGGGGATAGWTVYFGSRKSEAVLRIYDKAAEQGVKGPWVRVELEVKGDLADVLVREYLARGAVAVVEQIMARLRFTNGVSSDSNKRRAPVASWWAGLLGGVRPGGSLVAGERPQPTVERMAAWVERQAAPALATVVEGAGGELAWVFDLLARGRARQSSRHHAALVAYRAHAGRGSPGLATVA